jgi:hypothetical protein
MESEENIYSKEFIERLNNQNAPAVSAGPVRIQTAGLWIKIAIIAGVLVMVGVALALNAMSAERARQRILLINNLTALSVQSHEVTKKYQNNINDTKIRVVNEHFFQSLFGLNNDLEAYTKKVYSKEQDKVLKDDLKKTKTSLQDIFDRLHKADLNETLSRSYIHELTSLLDQNITALQKAINSGYYSKELVEQLKKHNTELLKVQAEIKNLEEQRAKQK